MDNLLNRDITRESISDVIDKLIRRYLDLPDASRTKMSEQDVRDYFVTPLLEGLGWGTVDPRERLAERHLPRQGFSDYELCLPLGPGDDPYVPLLYVEAKKFGELTALEEDLFGYERRSDADRQVIAYADAYNPKRGEKIGWAILTNFEFFRLWDTRRNVLVESTSWFNELKRDRTLDILYRLSRNEIARDPSLSSLLGYRKLPDIDEKFLTKLDEWRTRLGRAIWAQKGNRPKLGVTVLEQQSNLRDVVQRTLDRLIVIRTAEDRGLLEPPRRLQEMVRSFGGPNAVPLTLLENIQRNTFRYFDFHYNSNLFGSHLADAMEVHNEPLREIIEQLCKVSFESMNADILGATYEQYLGQTLVISPEDDIPNPVPNLETRHAQGSYYTPRYVVQEIVDQTLGRYLYGTEDGRPKGVPIVGRQRKTLSDIRNLTILDPACGSGSFLIYAFDVLLEFYSAEKKRLEKEHERKLGEIIATGVPRLAAEANHDPEILALRSELNNARFEHAQIIQRHLYGVDLDPQAAEVASMNLLLKALTRNERLPRILGDNVKVGNSLISGLQLTDTPGEVLTRLEELRRIRKSIHRETLLASENNNDRREHEEIIEQMEREFRSKADSLNNIADNNLRKAGDEGWFEKPELKRPFNWQIEYPEIFLRDDASQNRFTFVIGNPPYVGFHGFAEDKPFLKETYSTASGKFDIYVPFIERALALTAAGGELGFICPSTFMKRSFGKKLREFLLRETSIESVHDFLHTKVFREALNYTCIPRFRHSIPGPTQSIHYSEGEFIGNGARAFLQSKLTGAPWVFRFGSDEALVEKVRSASNSRALSELSQGASEGIVTACNSVLLIHSTDVEKLNLEKVFLRKCARGEDVKRYSFRWGGYYLFYPYVLNENGQRTVDQDTLTTQCPTLYQYLLDHKEELDTRHYLTASSKIWYELWCQRDLRLQEKQKIVVPELADRSQFAHVEPEFFYVDTTCGIAASEDNRAEIWYLLAALNSKIGEYLYRKTTVPKANGFLIYKTMYLNPFSIPLPTDARGRELMKRSSELAKQIQGINSQIVAIGEDFNGLLDSTLPMSSTSQGNFYDDYYSVSGFWNARRLIPANALDIIEPVAGIRVDGRIREPQDDANRNTLTISYRPEKVSAWKPLIELQPVNEDVGLFLLLSLRRFLFENARKKSWKLGSSGGKRTIDVVLKSLVVPVWGLLHGSNQFETNMKKISEVITMLRKTKGSALNPSLFEGSRDSLDRELDEIFFDLYGLSKDERDLVQDAIVR